MDSRQLMVTLSRGKTRHQLYLSILRAISFTESYWLSTWRPNVGAHLVKSLASTLINFRVFNGCEKSNVSLIYEHRGISGFNELVNETRRSSSKLDRETCSTKTHRKYTSFFIPFLLLQLYYKKERPLPGERYLTARCFFEKNYKLLFGGLALHSQASWYHFKSI